MFKKYCSIEYHYQQKYIDWFLSRYPELNDCIYVIEHKLDGSNFQFCFEPNGEWRVASRNNIIDSFGNFQRVNLQEFFKQDDIARLIYQFQGMAYDKGQNINVYGELIANHIQRRVNYGKDPQYRVFGTTINGEYCAPVDIDIKFGARGLDGLLVEKLGTAYGIEYALEFDTNISSNMVLDDGLIEGVVIKPYNKVYLDGNGSPFYLKKKNESFMERSRIKKTRTVPDNIVEKQKLFGEYVNRNRVLSVFSKYGEIESNKQLGEYIKYVLQDAKEDFMRDVSLEDIDKNDERQVFNVGSKVAHLLMEYL